MMEMANPDFLTRLEGQVDVAEGNEDFIAACCWAIGREEGTTMGYRRNQGTKLTALLYERGLVTIAENGARSLTELGRERASYHALKQLGA